MDTENSFSKKLKKYRAELGLTQPELSDASGLSVPQIARYERGASKPRMTAIAKLAKALNVSMEDLQGDISTAQSRIETSITVKYTNRKTNVTIYPPEDFVLKALSMVESEGSDPAIFDLFLAVLCCSNGDLSDERQVKALYLAIKNVSNGPH